MVEVAGTDVRDDMCTSNAVGCDWDCGAGNTCTSGGLTERRLGPAEAMGVGVEIAEAVGVVVVVVVVVGVIGEGRSIDADVGGIG